MRGVPAEGVGQDDRFGRSGRLPLPTAVWLRKRSASREFGSRRTRELRPRTAIVVAAMVQKGPAIASPGGYLRELTRKAEAGEFTLGPMLMALIGSRKRDKKWA
jgi:Replication protein C C-terminal region